MALKYKNLALVSAKLNAVSIFGFGNIALSSSVSNNTQSN